MISWILFSRYVDGWRNTLYALHPDTVVRWQRQGFRLYWRWKSRGPRPGRPPINIALRKLIHREVRGGHPVFVSQLVLLETEWVLRSRYDFQKEDIIKVVSGLLDAADVQLEDESEIEQALYIWKDHNAGFADGIIGARNSNLGCSATATFDAKASRLPGFVSV